MPFNHPIKTLVWSVVGTARSKTWAWYSTWNDLALPTSRNDLLYDSKPLWRIQNNIVRKSPAVYYVCQFTSFADDSSLPVLLLEHIHFEPTKYFVDTYVTRTWVVYMRCCVIEWVVYKCSLDKTLFKRGQVKYIFCLTSYGVFLVFEHIQQSMIYFINIMYLIVIQFKRKRTILYMNVHFNSFFLVWDAATCCVQSVIN